MHRIHQWTNMDILYWINLNSKVKFQDTKKMYFGRYIYRLEIFCPGGRLIHENSGSSMQELIEQRQMLDLGVSKYPDHVWKYRSRQINQADQSQLETFKSLLGHQAVKLRVEEPKLQVYAECEQDLKDIIEKFDSKNRARILSISAPKNSKAEGWLKENKIIRESRRNPYLYKVSLRDTRVDPGTKINLLNYLDSLEDMVFLPKAPREMMSAPFSSFWGVYFYTNDLSINTFLELIKPGIVSNINEIVVAE